jgi:hypothetical protein
VIPAFLIASKMSFGPLVRGEVPAFMLDHPTKAHVSLA